ncbi:uncharacterized protein Dwil_GK24200 [Drosophila willistoni]|uniref:Transmembrane protein n=1 Tax=Drosophila willistoni TaxID=7260 RepID=B4N1E3_DROWI|nr:uncharacterized protein LOC6643770 [Drosophila willistoni]EDW78080.1 uncharacterized protein Dwil_GK24200 [Drosophila willistoni]
MVKTIAVCVAFLCQLLGYSLFLSQPEDKCSPAPSLASWIFLLSTICFLSDFDLYPERFMHMANFWQVIIEIVASIFLAEIGTVIIWCGLERLIYALVVELLWLVGIGDCLRWLFEYSILGVVTTALSVAIFWYIIRATDNIYYMKKYWNKIIWSCYHFANLLRCYWRIGTKARARALRAYKIASKRRRRRKNEFACEDEDDDGYGDCVGNEGEDKCD